MFRKGLIPLLLDTPTSLSDIARLMDIPLRDAEEDVRHFIRSLKHTEYRLEILPARCRSCGFEFSSDKLRKPGKCPRCNKSRIRAPLLEVRVRTNTRHSPRE